MKYSCPRIVLAGNGGDSGKTMLSIGLLSYIRRLGLQVNGFKKGPDFIDAAWLTQAAQTKARNLDVYLMGEKIVSDSFKNHARNFDINIIEGNRGIFDGMDADGSFSTAELAKLLQAPVVLILDATKVTRTLAAFVLGCLTLDPELEISGIILNQVAGERHERVVRESIERHTGVKVLGAIPKLNRFDLLPERHLGLITPEEHGRINKVCEELGNIIEKYVDTAEIIKIAKSAPELEISSSKEDRGFYSKKDVSVGYFQDSAFTFYYPENLEALEKSGANLVSISPLDTTNLPDLDALYIGGGFPETHADLIAKNRNLLDQIKIAAEQGLPIYAECGGMIFLSHSLRYGNEVYPMANVLPFKIEMKSKPCGHGYCDFIVDRDNPFLPIGTQLKGHEFHYSTIVDGLEKVKTSYNVLRGKGFLDKREGFVYKNVLAGYFHVHALSNPVWADSIVRAAKTFKCEKKSDPILID
jgi:cobyrinic acid a,c-diamide synthase